MLLQERFSAATFRTFTSLTIACMLKPPRNRFVRKTQGPNPKGFHNLHVLPFSKHQSKEHSHKTKIASDTMKLMKRESIHVSNHTMVRDSRKPRSVSRHRGNSTLVLQCDTFRPCRCSSSIFNDRTLNVLLHIPLIHLYCYLASI